MKLSEFDYYLPDELIAQTPLLRRDESRLMVLDRASHSISHFHFYDLCQFLRSGDVLVMNDTKVIPARFLARRQTGGAVECFLVEEVSSGVWKALLQNAKRICEGEFIFVGENAKIQVLQKDVAEGVHLVSLPQPQDTFIEEYGLVPLPPYIQSSRSSDPQIQHEVKHRYQTVYAQNKGAVAAPTAGLHFTPELMAQCQKKGIGIHYVTLHVGLGTFLPIKVERIQDHVMHGEWFSISAETALQLNQARLEQRRIFAVGTTVARTLETVFDGQHYHAKTGQTSIFIYPGYEIRAFQGLLTNFHLPKSTLLLMIMAFAGQAFIRRAYDVAIAQKYRFYSFGDAMLIL